MDKVAQYQQVITEILHDYKIDADSDDKDASRQRIIIDKERNHYQLMTIGWREELKRDMYITVHLDIIDGKIWVQRDYTEPCVTDQLLERGVPNSDIVLGFQPPYKRPYTDFAIQ